MISLSTRLPTLLSVSTAHLAREERAAGWLEGRRDIPEENARVMRSSRSGSSTLYKGGWLGARMAAASTADAAPPRASK
jgi:hypothetical protein